jgi:hypothetical protein
MSFRAKLTAGLIGFGGFAWFGAAIGQSVVSLPPPAQSWAASNIPGTTLYQDKLIGDGSLAPDITNGGDVESSDTQGLARSLQVDAVASMLSARQSGSSTNEVESGFIARSQWETADYGAWSLDASARAGGSGLESEQGQGGVLTLRQRGMPFDGGWVADNALGDINTPDINLARIQPRFYLPTAPMQGITTDWHGPDGLQLVAGAGVPGIFDGIEVPDFRTLGGTTATVGVQWSPASHWTVGGQLVEAHDVNLAVGQVLDGVIGEVPTSSTTGLVSAAWADRGEHLQFNLLDGQVSGKPDAVGAWVDGSITQGRVQQSAGLFRIDPNMNWGNQVIADDMQGGYYRFDYQSRQWMTDVGIDEARSVSGQGANTTFLTGDARYQVSRDWGVGGVADASRSDGGNSWSLGGYLDHLNGWGTNRTQGDFAKTPTGQDSTLTLSQTWTMPVGTRLSTSAYVERVNGAVINGLLQDSTLLGVAAFGGGQFTPKLGAEGNVNWASAIQGRAAPGVSANVSLTYRISQNWQILATYYDSRTGSWTPLTVESPLSQPVPTAVPSMEEKGIFLTIRYKREAGLHFAPLGGGPGAGSGELNGIVYLDANNNGQPDAGEAGAPNVTVVLDGRYSVQTDANGRFEFPVVVTGHHVVQVISDNLPLPWNLAGGGRVEVEVKTRDHTEISIGAQRLR